MKDIEVKMRNYSFREQNNKSKDSAWLVGSHLSTLPETQTVVDVQDNPTFQTRDVDFVQTLQSGSQVMVEVKGDERMSRTGNVFFETASNYEKGTQGCFLTSEADYWYYVDTNNKLCYTMNLGSVRNWFGSYEDNFREVSTSTSHNGSFLYSSRGKLVPVGSLLELDCVSIIQL